MLEQDTQKQQVISPATVGVEFAPCGTEALMAAKSRNSRKAVRSGGRRRATSAQHGKYSADEIRRGLPVGALDELAGTLKVDARDLAEILGTSVRTLQRKSGDNDRLAPAASDRLARIRRILDLATYIFGEADKASAWLTTTSRSLGGEVPLRMLDTDTGSQRVQQELRQIEFGMPL